MNYPKFGGGNRTPISSATAKVTRVATVQTDTNTRFTEDVYVNKDVTPPVEIRIKRVFAANQWNDNRYFRNGAQVFEEDLDIKERGHFYNIDKLGQAGAWRVMSKARSFDQEAFELFLVELTSARALDLDAKFSNQSHNPMLFFRQISLSLDDMKEFRRRVREVGGVVTQAQYDHEEALAAAVQLLEDANHYVTASSDLRTRTNELMEALPSLSQEEGESRLQAIDDDLTALSARKLWLDLQWTTLRSSDMEQATTLSRARFNAIVGQLADEGYSSRNLNDVRETIETVATRMQRMAGGIRAAAPNLEQELRMLARRFPVLAHLATKRGSNGKDYITVKVTNDIEVFVTQDLVVLEASQEKLHQLLMEQMSQAQVIKSEGDRQFDDI